MLRAPGEASAVPMSTPRDVRLSREGWQVSPEHREGRQEQLEGQEEGSSNRNKWEE